MSTDSYIEFWMTDLDAAADAEVTIAGGWQSWADPQDAPRNYPADHLPDPATLEPDFGWPLDGSRDIMPDDPSVWDWGVWSAALSGAGGLMEFTVDIRFSAPHSSTGVTLEFCGALASEAEVRWFDPEGALMAEETYLPDESLFFCERMVEDYGRVVIELHGLDAPGRWLRLPSILFGNLEVIGSERITRAILTEDRDPTLATLPISTLELSFYTGGDRFRMLGRDSAYRAFRRRQRADVFKEIDGVKEKVYILYLAELGGVEDAVTSLVFEDILGILDRESFDGGMYENYPAAQLLSDMGLRFELDAGLAGATVTGHLPVQSKRESLRDICFAIGAQVDTRKGFVCLSAEQTEPLQTIGPDRRVTGHELKQGDLITRVEVTAHSWTLVKQEEDDEMPTLASGTFPIGVHRIEFSDPGIWKEIRGGAWPIGKDNVNFVVLDVQEEDEQEVEIVGWMYRDSASVAAAEAERIPSGQEPQTESFEAGALTDPAAGQRAAERLYAIRQRRYTDKGDLLPGWERAGDCVQLETPWGSSLKGWIEQLVTDLFHGCIQTATVRGGPVS